MPNELISLDDAYANEACKGSLFTAVKMMAEEARFINEQANMGFIELTKKPTTIAMAKFKADRLEKANDNRVQAPVEEDWES